MKRVWLLILVSVLTVFCCSCEKEDSAGGNVVLKNEEIQDSINENIINSDIDESFVSNEVNADEIVSLEEVSFDEYFLPGYYGASTMEVVIPDEYILKANELSMKFNESAVEHKEWFKEYILEHPEGILPWHENFGITEDEYEFFLNISEKQVLREKYRITLEFIEDNGTLLIKEHPYLKYCDELVFDGSNNVIIGSRVQLEYEDHINNDDINSLTGVWKGKKWSATIGDLISIEEMTEDSPGIYELSIGRLEESQKTLLYYNQVTVENGYSDNGKEILYIDKDRMEFTEAEDTLVKLDDYDIPEFLRTSMESLLKDEFVSGWDYALAYNPNKDIVEPSNRLSLMFTVSEETRGIYTINDKRDKMFGGDINIDLVNNVVSTHGDVLNYEGEITFFEYTREDVTAGQWLCVIVDKDKEVVGYRKVIIGVMAETGKPFIYHEGSIPEEYQKYNYDFCVLLD